MYPRLILSSYWYFPFAKLAYYKINERLLAKILLVIVLVYLLLYGILVTNGFHLTSFDPIYLGILLPIFLIDSVKTLFECLLLPKFWPSTNQDLTKVTVIIPTLNGGEELKSTLLDLLRRFPPDHILVVSNGSTDNTVAISRSLGVQVMDIRRGIGKVAAINAALPQVATPYSLIIDDDVLVGDACIPTDILDSGYEGVAFRVLPIVKNKIGLLQLHEYQKSMDVGRRFHNRKATVQSISGAIGLFHTSELIRQIHLHTAEFSGEDLQRTLLVHLKSFPKGVVICNSIVTTEVPQTISQLFYQRIIGWHPGLMSNIKNYIKILTRNHSPFYLKYDAFYNCFLVILCDPLRLLALPIIVYYPWYFVVMYLVYVLAETVPYLRLKSKVPYWVILVSPLYGLFSFITRIISLAVFAYRRLAYYLGKLQLFDDYKVAGWLTKLYSLIIVVFASVFFLLSYIIIKSS